MIYLDHHAASPLEEAARAAMDRARPLAWANPSSPHADGRAARAIVENARRAIASALSVAPAHVTFTAGGSEACQTGIEGLAAGDAGIRTVVTTTLEHPAVAQTVERLERRGVAVIRLAARPEGIAFDTLERSLGADVLVAMQWVNHEVGTVLPVERVARACRGVGARLFVDATQALGKVAVDLGALGATAVALASTKVGGPAGAGALVVEPGVSLEPLLVGGSQERGLRAGTPNVEAIAGFGAATAAVDARLLAMPRVGALRDRLESGLVAMGARVNGAEGPRVASCTNVAFTGSRASVLAAALDLEGVAVAIGPACSSGLDTPSPTVLAMYPDDPARASSSLRFSLAPSTREDEIDAALGAVERVLARRVPR